MGHLSLCLAFVPLYVVKLLLFCFLCTKFYPQLWIAFCPGGRPESCLVSWFVVGRRLCAHINSVERCLLLFQPMYPTYKFSTKKFVTLVFKAKAIHVLSFSLPFRLWKRILISFLISELTETDESASCVLKCRSKKRQKENYLYILLLSPSKSLKLTHEKTIDIPTPTPIHKMGDPLQMAKEFRTTNQKFIYL